jgi:hypothetical protein
MRGKGRVWGEGCGGARSSSACGCTATPTAELCRLTARSQSKRLEALPISNHHVL